MKAEEFLRNAKQDADKRWTAKKMLIEFAKYHVEQALLKASKEAHVEVLDYNDYEVNKKSILNAYPLENIK